MNKPRKLKYATVLLVLCMINVVLFGLAAIGFLFLKEFLNVFLSEQYAQEFAQFDILFYGGAAVAAIFAVLMLVSGIRAQYSKGWTIFLIVISALIVVSYGLPQLDLIGLALYGSMLVFSVLNFLDANERDNEAVGPNSKQDLESKLQALNDLYDKGLISTEEYQSSRQEAITKID